MSEVDGASKRDSPSSFGPLVIAVPPDWTYQHQVTIRLPPFPGLVGHDFEANIIVIKHVLSPADTSIEAVADGRRRALSLHLPQFEFDLSTWIELFGRRAIRLMYTWHNGVHRLRQMLVLWAAEGVLYEITYSDVAARFGDTVGHFDRWLAGLGLVGAPATAAAGGSTAP